MGSGKDEGTTSSTPNEVPSSSRRRKQIMRQIEFYLSESNLSRDSFFSSEMKRSGQPGVNISLLLQCHRLICLGATEELIRRAVRRSTIVKLSEDGQMVLRCHPLGELGPKEKRTILVVGLPRWSHPVLPSEPTRDDGQPDESSGEHLPSRQDSVEEKSTTSTTTTGKVSEIEEARWTMIDWLHESFGAYGPVLYVNLPFPLTSIPVDHFSYHNSGMFRGFAFVEFASSKSARTAAQSMCPRPEEGERWFTAPSTTDVECPENAWKPRLAARASFCQSDMLARRYVWRCCSRRNKQILSCFRQLRHAGYRAPNPCDREYELITLGESSPDARERHLKSSYGEPSMDRICVFRYSVWTFWRTKFYVWLNAWAARMRGKTEELSIKQLTADLESTKPIDSQDTGEVVVVEADPKQVDSICEDYQLPRDFVPGSVVRVNWSLQLITEAESLKTITTTMDADNQPAIKVQNMSFPRRLRISIEHHLLSPSQLLQEVAHFDSNPSCKVLDRLDPMANTGQPAEYHVILLRMRSASAAEQLIAFVDQRLSEGHLDPNLVSVRLLAEAEERLYCQAIFESKIGATERRRRVQAKRRERTKQGGRQEEGSREDGTSTNRGIVVGSSGEGGAAISRPSSAKKTKHIFFEEENT